jgi:hypothetical protein
MTRPHRLLRAALVLFPLCLGAACDDSPSFPDAAAPADGGASDSAASDSGAGDSAASDTGAGDGGAGDSGATTLGVVVVNTNYKFTSVSLVDPATNTVTREKCIDSDSKSTTLTTLLSGDVVLPTAAQPGNEVLLIDRAKSTLTWVSPQSCEVARQLNVGEQMKDANPQDAIAINAHKIYVPRYAGVFSDVAIVDPTSAAITGKIDLKASTPALDGKQLLPNPGLGVLAGGKVYVVLTALTEDTKAGGVGRVVTIDPATDAVVGTIDLPGLKNCVGITATTGGLVVGCGGVYGDPNQMAESGLAWIDLAATPPAVKVVASQVLGRGMSPFSVAALSPSQIFVITDGEFTGTPPDQVWMVDATAGTARKIFDGTAAFTLSGLLVDQGRKKLFFADGNDKTPRLQVLDLAAAGGPTPVASPSTNAAALPPRYLSWY